MGMGMTAYQPHSDTSKQAADKAKDNASSQRRRVLRFLVQLGDHGATDEEIATRLEINPSTARPRRVELIESKQVKDSGKTRKTKSGRDAVVWVAETVPQRPARKGVLALDVAGVTGWAHSNGEYGIWTMPPGRGPALIRLRNEIIKMHKRAPIRLIAFEASFWGAPSMVQKVWHGQNEGAILMAAAEIDAETCSYYPTSMKKWLTGSGRADKEQMVAAVQKRFGLDDVTDHNIADAITVLAMVKSGMRQQPGSPAKGETGKRKAAKKKTGKAAEEEIQKTLSF